MKCKQNICTHKHQTGTTDPSVQCSQVSKWYLLYALFRSVVCKVRSQSRFVIRKYWQHNSETYISRITHIYLKFDLHYKGYCHVRLCLLLLSPALHSCHDHTHGVRYISTSLLIMCVVEIQRTLTHVFSTQYSNLSSGFEWVQYTRTYMMMYLVSM